MLGTAEGQKEAETQELALATNIRNHPWVRYPGTARPSSLFYLPVSFLPPTGRIYQDAVGKGHALESGPHRSVENRTLGRG